MTNRPIEHRCVQEEKKLRSINLIETNKEGKTYHTDEDRQTYPDLKSFRNNYISNGMQLDKENSLCHPKKRLGMRNRKGKKTDIMKKI